jgi:peptidoglycan hydrolase-like protein with peptidoglycan-binding domain
MQWPRLRVLLRAFARRPADTVGCILILVATLAILVNALYLQAGQHPAPMLGTGALPSSGAETTGSLIAMPRPRPAEAAAPPKEGAAAPRPRGQVLAEIQSELARRGFYEGPVDGVYGPKMDAAIRDFEQAAGLRSTAEPGEALLRSIMATPVKTERGKPSAPQPSSRRAESASGGNVSGRVLAVQRALAEFGYGQLKLTGIFDEATKAAVEKFERERKLPISGQLSARLMRELAAVTGRPLE